MPAYRLTRDAQSDLIEIRRYTLQQWGPIQSRKYISDLRKTLCILAETPPLGKSRSDVGPEVLSFPCASHVIYYVMDKTPLIVFGVLHKSVLPVGHLSDRRVI